ncbi:MAG: cysteine-rich repeat protein [Candidatus Binatia bacterium]|jgi:cysteine-rich repeat protein
MGFRLRRSTGFVACLAAASSLILLAAGTAGAQNIFTAFESGSVRPLALTPDGTTLVACNTPDNRLEVFSAVGGTLTPVGSVAVGLEPVAVAARSNTEVWVVNHLSDSVSIVDLTDPSAPRVTRTLLVGDEPRDLVFGGTAGNLAFITAAHRGQNNPNSSQLTSEGVGRADVWVFDADNLGSSLGGDEETIITLFGDTPRALAVSADGSTVYAAVFHSGNRTTTVSDGAIPDGGIGAGGIPGPNVNHNGDAAPEVGLIVRFDGTNWIDELARSWDSVVRFSLPDFDVFAIDATADPPIPVAGPSGTIPGVGTILFNMVVNPVSGKVYVSNLESRNEVRFEGPGDFASTTVRGHIAESRITVIDGLTVAPRHLNKHIDYNTCCAAIPNTENADSLAFPLEMVVSADGATLYVAGFGSSEVGVYSTAALENDSFTPSAANQIAVSGGGPTGLVLDEANDRLYTLTRFNNSIAVIDTTTAAELSSVALYNPEPAVIRDGRRFLYDASLSSSHGDSACASCHIFGDFDSLAWDLGDPDGDIVNNPGPFAVGPFIDPDFHPMKGPMTTQSLRGMANHGPMHWRGDRTGGNATSSAQPDSGTFDEQAAFNAFSGAFVGLLGRDQELTTGQMQAFTDFILEVMYPPNPIRALNNTLSTSAQTGSNFYFGATSDTFQDCNGCHVLNPNGNAGSTDKPGFFGTDGRSSFENEPQIFKVAHLRNMYQKVGMFGMPAVSFFNSGDNAHKGDQVRGFGFIHDGSVDTLFRFHEATVFNQSITNPNGILNNATGDITRRDLEAFMFEFPSNHAPVVGQQITRAAGASTALDTRITLLIARADAGECDLSVKGTVSGEARGYRRQGGAFVSDRSADATLSDATLRALANTAGQELTYTCTPVGSGQRIGIDRDLDTFLDRDELDAGSDPADPISIPGSGPVCGDEVVESPEECDNGLLNSDATPNACRTDCTFPVCSDGVADTGFGEQCDDGNASNADACHNDCQLPTCGDGITDSGEACDDGAGNSDVLADACRSDCSVANCGDGVTDSSEQCDDGNAIDTDACRNDCVLPDCGDNILDAGESCDDGNADNTDACLDTCADASCGDGFVQTGVDECDDGAGNSNIVPDACRNDCTAPVCGDSVTDSGEGCDDGNLDDNDACHNDCTLETCGNGSIDVGEECDDANADDTDACLNSCLDATCGDGFVHGGTEACDNGGANSDTTPDACRADCSVASCGDAVADSGEACDDGNASNNDDCLDSCMAAQCGDGFVETGIEACDNGVGNSDTTPDACRLDCSTSICGDGVADTAETCDGDDLESQTCQDNGFAGGTLACAPDCTPDTTACAKSAGIRTLKVVRLHRAAGDQKLVLKTDEIDGSGDIFNLLEDAMTISVSTGTEIFTATVDALDPNWKLAGSKWKWKPAKGTTHPTGLKNIIIGISNGPFKLKVVAKDADASGALDATQLGLAVAVGDNFYQGTAPCTVKAGKAVKCRN